MAAIALEGNVNGRDVGGLVTRDGRAVVLGRLLRSETPELATPADVETLVDVHGVSLVVDLRSPQHAVGGSGLLGQRVRRVVVDFAGRSGGMGSGPTLEPEAWLPAQLERAGPVAVEVLSLLVANRSGATLVHCHTGKDRTGFVVASALLVAGVRREDILADYLASAPVHERMLDRLTAAGLWMAEAPPFARAPASAAAMTVFLDRFAEAWPDPDAWLVQHGAPADLGDRVRAHLLAPS